MDRLAGEGTVRRVRRLDLRPGLGVPGGQASVPAAGVELVLAPPAGALQQHLALRNILT